MTRNFFLFLFYVLLFCCKSQADETNFYKSISLDSEIEKDYHSYNLGLSLTSKPQEGKFYFSFANFNYLKAESRSISDTETLVTTNRDINASLAFSYYEYVELIVNGGQTNSPETEFTKKYRILELGLSKAGENNPFPHFGFSVLYGTSELTQPITFKILNKTITRNPELNQTLFGIKLNISPVQNFKLKLSVRGYTYSETKEDLQKAYSSIFLSTKASDLVSTIGGIPENSLDFSAQYFIGNSYSAELFYGTSLLIITDNKDFRTGLALNRYFETFSLNLGFSQNKTESSQTNSLLAGAAFDF